MICLSCSLLIVEVSVIAATEKGKTFRASIWSSFVSYVSVYINLIMSPDNTSWTKSGICHAGAIRCGSVYCESKIFSAN